MEGLSADACAEIDVLRSIFEDLVDVPPPPTALVAVRLLVPVAVPEAGIACIAPTPGFPVTALAAASIPPPPTATALLRRGSSSSAGDAAGMGATHPPRLRLLSLTSLPPLEMTVAFPAGYPATESPTVCLRAPWLGAALGRALLRGLSPAWAPGDACVFAWHSWLSDELLRVMLGAGSPPPPWSADVRLSRAAVRLLQPPIDPTAGAAQLQLPRLATAAAEALTNASGSVDSGPVERCLVLDASAGIPVWPEPLPRTLPQAGTVGTASTSAAAAAPPAAAPLSDGGGVLSALSSLSACVDALLSADLASRRSAWLSGTHTCPICLDDRAGADCLALAACSHAFCRACLRAHTLETLRGGFAASAAAAGGGAAGEVKEGAGPGLGVACPDVSCGRLLEHHDVRAVLVPAGHAEEFARYEALLLQRFLALEGGATCPNPACGSELGGGGRLFRFLTTTLLPAARLPVPGACIEGQ